MLQVPVGKTLSFVGGGIDIGGGDLPQGFVSAPDGRVNLVSAASPGEAIIQSDGSIDANNFEQLGYINITGNSFVDAKDVYIRSGQLTIEDATIFPATCYSCTVYPFPNLTEALSISVSPVTSRSTASGEPVLNTPGIQAFNGSPGGLVSGDAPAIHINANSVSVSGPDAQIGTARFGPDTLKSPDIEINTQTLSITDGASIVLLNFFEGDGGTITVNTDSTTIANDFDTPIFTGIGTQSYFTQVMARSFSLFWQMRTAGHSYLTATI